MRLLKPLILAAGIVVAGSAWAGDAAIKYRQDHMKVLGGHMGSIAAIMKREVPFSEQLEVHAQGLAVNAVFTKELFKERALNNKSSSKAEIWTDWQRFASDADALQQAADKLAQAVAANNQAAMRTSMAAAGKACKSCHDSFKTK